MSYEQLSPDKKQQYEERALVLIEQGHFLMDVDQLDIAAEKLYRYEVEYGIQL